MTAGGTRRTNEQWLAELRADGAPGDAAREALRSLVAGAVRKATAAQGPLDDATAEDLTQVAVVKVLDNLHRFEGRSKFTTWVYSVAVRAAFSELRKATYRSGGDSLGEEHAEALTTDEPAPSNWAERSEIVEVMHRVIAEELTERQRTAILGELSATPTEELLETLGTNRNAYYKLVHDARAKLVKGLRGAGICDDQVREAFDL